MKVVAFNGSPRSNGNTTLLVNTVFEELHKEGIETELVQLACSHLHGCTACYQCFEMKSQQCAMKADILNDCIRKMVAADGIILASPTYFAGVTSELKALIDRAGMTGKANGDLYRRKVGAAVLAVRRGGVTHAFDTINHFFLISQMIVPGSCYWNFAFGRNPGEAAQDEEGMHTMRVLGQNMAWLLKKLKS